MKRAILLGVTLAAALIAVLPGISKAAPGSDVNGPACVNFNGINVSYNGAGASRDQPPYTFAAQVFLGSDGMASACKNITYTLYIVTDIGATPSQLSPNPADLLEGRVTFGPVGVTDDDADICIYGTTARGSRILDTAPDTACLQLHAGATGGLAGFS